MKNKNCIFAIIIAIVLEVFLFNARSFELIGCKEKSVSVRVPAAEMKYENGMLEFEVRGKHVIPSDLRMVRLILSEAPELPVSGSIHTEETLLQKGHDQDFYWTPGILHSQNVAVFPANRVLNMRFTMKELPPQDIEVRFNEPLPLQLNPLRILLVTAVLCLAYLLRPSSPLWEIRLNTDSKGQRMALTGLLILLTGVGIFTNFSSYPDLSNMHILSDVEENCKFQYKRLTDALLQGSLSLLEEPPAALAEMNNPYDPDERGKIENVLWDTAYYKGKYYVYFGIVPVVTLLIPWRILTGTDLSMDFMILFYAILGSVGLVFFYTRLLKRYFPKVPAILYLLGIPFLLGGSCLICCLRKPMVYEAVMTASFCFSCWGLFFADFARREDGSFRKGRLALACTLLALAVGCKPTAIGMSLLLIPLVLVPLWNNVRNDPRLRFAVPLPEEEAPDALTVSGKASLKNRIGAMLPTLIACAVPYILIGAGLAWYNYARFGNPLEFGQNYNLTSEDNRALSSGSPIGNLLFTYINFFFGSGVQLISRFPFIKEANYLTLNYGGTRFLQNLVPVNNLCIWCLAIPFLGFVRRFFRAKGKDFAVTFWTLFACSLIIGAVCGSVGFYQRYCLDFYWPMILCGLFAFLLFYEWAEENGAQKALRLLFLLSFAVGMFVCMGMWVGEPSMFDRSWLESFNPLLFERLNYFFAFWM